MPRFSIVVPAHNVEPYLRECLDSLLNQTFGDFEVICVDDASTDGTRAVIEEYCARDKRIRLVVNTVNMHLFATRHVGVRETTGEYVTFVDGDDALTIDALENLDAVLKEDPVDILQFCMKVVPQEGVELLGDEWCLARYEPRLLKGDEIVRTVCYEQPEDMCTHHRMIRGDLARRVLVDLGFDRNLHVSEDITEQTALMISANTYRIINPADYYIYNLGRGGNGANELLSKEQFSKLNLAKWRCYKTLMRYLDDFELHNPGDDMAIAWRWRYACAQSLWHWSASVVPEDRADSLVEFAGMWPIGWVLTQIYNFIADDIEELFSPGSVFRDDRILSAEQDLAINLECLARLFPLYDRNPVNSDITSEVWQDMARQAAECAANETRPSDELLMTCLRGICLFARNEEWFTDDKLQQYESIDRQLEKAQSELDDIVTSRSYRLSSLLAKPYRFIRRGRTKDGK